MSKMEISVIQCKGKGKLLRKYSLTELDTLLTSLAQLVGVTPANQPDINAMKLLMNSVIQLYGHLTDQEVKNAFNLLIAGEYELQKEDDHFQSFSAKYFSTVIRKYLSYATKILKDIPEENKPVELPPIPQTDEEFINDCFHEWSILKNKFYQYINHAVYDKLVAKGLLNLSETYRDGIKEKVKHDLYQSKNERGYAELTDRLLQIQESPDGVFFTRQCKKYAVAEYFNKLLSEGKITVL